MEKPKLDIGSYVPDFELPGVDGSVYHLARYLESHQVVVVVFLANQCSGSTQYLPHLKQLQQELIDSRISIIGINAVDDSQFPQESFNAMKEFAMEHQLNFPYIRDFSQDVAYSFGVKVTPTAFVINNEGKLCYQGAIATGSNYYLKDSLAALAHRNPMANPITPVQGTKLEWRNLERR